ncbi:immunoglobulin domain-containing family protein [Flindersiella endophytica]
MSDEYLTDEQEQYYRYNPRVPVDEYKDRWNRATRADPPLNREPPGPASVQLVDVIMGYAPADIADRWLEVRKFLMDPGDPARLRAAADAWCPEGRSGGTGSLYGMAKAWNRKLHDSMYELKLRWSDSASEALESYLNDKVDSDCLGPLEEHCEKIAIALRAKAEAQEAAKKSVDGMLIDLASSSGAGLLVGAALAPFTVDTLSAVAIGAAVAVASGLVKIAFDIVRGYFEFAKACEDALDRIGVEMSPLGGFGGRWPRPWAG